MKPPEVQYVAPQSIEEAVALKAEFGFDALVLAGGQSLVPMLSLRLARPTYLIDITRIPELSECVIDGDDVRIGAAVRQRKVELIDAVATAVPALRAALREVGHIQIRSRGTVCGSIAHADPAAEICAAAAALDAQIRIASVRGYRTVAARDFLQGPYATCIQEDEIVTEATFSATPGASACCKELTRRRGDFAIAGILGQSASVVDRDSKFQVRLAAFGVGSKATRLHSAEQMLRSATEVTPGLIAEASEEAAREVDPFNDHHASAIERRVLIRTLTKRALTEMFS